MRTRRLIERAICRVGGRYVEPFWCCRFCLYGTDAVSRREFLETISETGSESRETRRSSTLFFVTRVASRDRGTYRIIRALHDNMRESAAKKKRKKKSKRDPETSRHPWLSILLIDHRYPPIITLTLVPIIIEDILSTIVPIVENCRVSFGPNYL